MAFISQAEWARRNGFSKQYVNQLVRNGTVRLVNGKINSQEADAILSSLRNPSYEQKRSFSSADNNTELSTLLLKTRIKNEVEKGRLLEAKVRVEIGELVDAAKVKEAAFNKARIVRDGMLNIPDRVSSIIASIDDEHKIHEILTNEIRLVLEELSNG